MENSRIKINVRNTTLYDLDMCEIIKYGSINYIKTVLNVFLISSR